MCADVRRLPILEALYIKDINPKLNVQANDLQALPSMKRTKSNNSLLTEKQSEESTTNKRRPLTETKINEKQKLSTNQRRPLTRAAARLHKKKGASTQRLPRGLHRSNSGPGAQCPVCVPHSLSVSSGPGVSVWPVVFSSGEWCVAGVTQPECLCVFVLCGAREREWE
ncbi:hypothetical protein GWK47_033881 [Chionoecetes opilio]|uniref:Uncharacterized protein n=1 Tax=Chionoecetes opilio TaxID=41210 RepID=A0A8J4YHY0_CHIOP|nr:hypothetical protein GWK47_033881 [Chionoecetes opilio]